MYELSQRQPVAHVTLEARQVLVEFAYAVGEDSDLNLGAAGVVWLGGIGKGSDDALPVLVRETSSIRVAQVNELCEVLALLQLGSLAGLDRFDLLRVVLVHGLRWAPSVIE